MRGMLLKALAGLLVLAATPCLAQTRAELQRRYGQPETLSHKSSAILVERYNVLTGVTMTVKFGDGERACELRVEPQRTQTSNARRSEVIKASDANMLMTELAPPTQRGRSIKTSDVEFGCSAVAYREYEHVMIATITLCARQGGGVQSITIRWKEQACEQVDRKGNASAVARLNN